MAKLIRYAVIAWLVAVLGVQFIRPPRTNPVTDPIADVERGDARAGGGAGGARAVLPRLSLERHRWPWYSNVAPMSWLVIDHVDHGRRHFNYSDWASLQRDEAPKVLRGICDLPRKGEMPIGCVHADAP